MICKNKINITLTFKTNKFQQNSEINYKKYIYIYRRGQKSVYADMFSIVCVSYVNVITEW